MGELFEADLNGVIAWARGIVASRPADEVIGVNYLERWWVIPRNPFCNIYLHRFSGSDEDRALHDHPWDNRSVMLEGLLSEIMPDDLLMLAPGMVRDREATDLHRFELRSQTAMTLFITGPRIREWGFACPQGWVHWRDFVNPDDPGQIGAGCGEA